MEYYKMTCQNDKSRSLVIVKWHDKIINVGFWCVFFIERCYVYNNFTINYGWLVIIVSNLNLTSRLIF